MIKKENIRYCDFCGKSQDDVDLMIAGPGPDICDECVDLCVEILVRRRIEQRKKKEEKS